MKVSIDGLAAAIADELESYSEGVTVKLKREVRKAAREAVDELKTTSPQKTGDYAAGWGVKKEFEDQTDIRLRVVNRNAPQLTHLLEHGHAKVTGGRVAGQPHIGPAEQRATAKLEGKVKVIIK